MKDGQDDRSRARRALRALVLLAIWVSSPATAQVPSADVFSQSGESRGSASTVPGPAALGDTEVMRSERNAGSPVVRAPTPVEEALNPDEYVCGPGDVFELNFWGVQNFRQRVAVDLEGRAFVPKVGQIPLSGKTLTQARRDVGAAIRRFFPRLNFDVSLVEQRSFLVHLVENVAKPGIYTAQPTERLTTILARAGGATPQASRRRIEITHRDGRTETADLLLYSFTGDRRHNPHLLDGDVVHVPFEQMAASISGAVRRPGRYELLGSRDLKELVELAGGFAPTRTRELPIRIVRRGAGDRDEQILIPAKDAAAPVVELKHDDAVAIPGVGELQQSIVLTGALAGSSPADEAASTRRLVFVRGDSVRTLLERAGGVSPNADLERAYVVRGDTTVEVDLQRLLVLRDLSADRPVQLGDTVVIPFKRRSVLVSGAVFNPGVYPFNPVFRADQYLGLAGGPNRFARSLSEVRVIDQKGHVQPYAPGLAVQPGDALIVPERDFSRSEVVQLVLGAAGLVVSSVALFIVARK